MSVEAVGRPGAERVRAVHDHYASALRSYALGLVGTPLPDATVGRVGC